MLDNSVVLGGRPDKLATFPEVMRAGLFDIHVLACLTRPDCHQGMPVIWRSNRNGIDRFVLKQLANIRKGFSFSTDFATPLVENPLVHVAKRCDFHVR